MRKSRFSDAAIMAAPAPSLMAAIEPSWSASSHRRSVVPAPTYKTSGSSTADAKMLYCSLNARYRSGNIRLSSLLYSRHRE